MSHNHTHNGMFEHHKLIITRLLLSLVLNVAGRILEQNHAASSILFWIALIIAGYDILFESFEELYHKHFFDENILIVIVTVAACIIGELEEAATIVLLFQLGELIQAFSVSYSMKKIKQVSADHFSTEEFTNERKMMKKFSSIYTPIMLGGALICIIVFGLTGMGFQESIYRGLVVLVAACPCAVVISVPLAYSAGMTASAEESVFFKGDSAIDSVSRCKSEKSLTTEDAYDGCVMVRIAEKRAPIAVVKRTKTNAALRVYRIAKRIKKTAIVNMALALALKAVVIMIGILGKCPVWLAVFADAGICIITIANALRLLKLSFKSRRIKV